MVGRFGAKIYIATILRAVSISRGIGTEVMAGVYVTYIGAAFYHRRLFSSRPTFARLFSVSPSQSYFPAAMAHYRSSLRFVVPYLEELLRNIRYLKIITHARR